MCKFVGEMVNGLDIRHRIEKSRLTLLHEIFATR